MMLTELCNQQPVCRGLAQHDSNSNKDMLNSSAT